MNKPATKEPSMDEILSSIRQIIADDDAAVAKAQAASEPDPEPDMASIPSFDAFLADEAPEEPVATAEEEEDFGLPSFDLEPEAEESELDAEALELSLDQVVDEHEAPAGDFAADLTEEDAEVGFSVPDDVAFVGLEAADADMPEPAAPAANAMPDPKLSDDIADRLLESTTQAAASQAFARLGSFGAMGLGAEGQTIEGVVRELLRPMLKAWLDENLPSVVERLVEREIERVSRGNR